MKEAINILRKAIKYRKRHPNYPTKKTLQKRKNFAPGGHYDEYHLLNSPEHKSRGWSARAWEHEQDPLTFGDWLLHTDAHHPGDESTLAPPGHLDRGSNVNHIKAVELKSNSGYSRYDNPWEEYKAETRHYLGESFGHHKVQNLSQPKEVHHIIHRSPNNSDQWQVTHMNPHTGSVIGVEPKRDFRHALDSAKRGDTLFDKDFGSITHEFVPAHITKIHYHDPK